MATDTLSRLIRGQTSSRSLTSDLNTVLVYIESALALDEQLHPRCPCCGATKNLVSFASGWLCQAAAREQLSAKE